MEIDEMCHICDLIFTFTQLCIFFSPCCILPDFSLKNNMIIINMHYRHTRNLYFISVPDRRGLKECKCAQKRSFLIAGEPALGPVGPYLQQGERRLISMQTLAEKNSQMNVSDWLPVRESSASSETLREDGGGCRACRHRCCGLSECRASIPSSNYCTYVIYI